MATGCVAQPSLRATIVASFPGVFPRERSYIARGALDERTRAGLMLVAYGGNVADRSYLGGSVCLVDSVCVNTDVTMGNW